jgi:CheY-like chemotaxis protein
MRVINKCAMSKKILIVDDNVLMIEVMTYILINNGYEVTSLTNGMDVFNNIRNTHPDLVILDAILPGMSGREICQLLKLNKATRDLPVIMCSGDDTIMDTLKQQGAPNDVLQKPFDISCLIEMVEYQLAA